MSYVDPYSDDHRIFGPTLKLEQLSKEKLPTQLELVNVVRGLKKQFVKPGPGNTILRCDKIKIYSDIATFLTEIWKGKAKIPVPSFKYAREVLEKHIEDILLYVSQRRTDTLNSEESIAEYISNLRKTYNFAKCKCFVSGKNEYKIESIEEITIARCKCKEKDQIPRSSLSLYADQLFQRELRTWIIEAAKEDNAEVESFVEGELISSSDHRICFDKEYK